MSQYLNRCATYMALIMLAPLLGAAADGVSPGTPSPRPDETASSLQRVAGDLGHVSASGRMEAVTSDLASVAASRMEGIVPEEPGRFAAIGTRLDDENSVEEEVVDDSVPSDGGQAEVPQPPEKASPVSDAAAPAKSPETAASEEKDAGEVPVEEAGDAGDETEPPGPRSVPQPVTTEANASLATQIRALIRGGEAGTDPVVSGGVTSGAAPAKPAAEDISQMSAPPVQPPSVSAPVLPPGGGDAQAPPPPAIPPAAPVRPKFQGDPLEQIVNIDFREMDLTNVVALLAHKADINVIAGTDLRGTVTANLRNVPLRQALETALRMNNLGMVEEEGIYRIVPYEDAMAVNRMTEIVKLDNAKAEDVGKVLTDVSKGMGDRAGYSITSNKAANLLVITAPKHRIQELISLAKSLDLEKPVLPTVTEAIPLSYSEPKDVLKIVEPMLSPDFGKASADDRARHIIITDIPVVIEQVKTLIASLDMPVKQVMIETMVVDILLNDEADTGVKWLFDTLQRQSRANAAIGPDAPTVGTLQDLALETSMDVMQNPGSLLNFGLLTKNLDWKGAIQMEVRNRNGRLVSNPVVLTVENQMAQISISQEIPYIELRQTQQGGSQTTTSFKEVGTVLSVTPQVTHDNHIICKIEGKESATSGEFQGVPIEDKREIISTMRMANGQTIFIGGLRKNDNNSSVRKVPILGDIPMAGVMFRTNQRRERINELLVFITCNVLDEQTSLTERQQQVISDAHPADPKVDALQTVGYDIMHPTAVKRPQMKWRRGE